MSWQVCRQRQKVGASKAAAAAAGKHIRCGRRTVLQQPQRIPQGPPISTTATPSSSVSPCSQANGVVGSAPEDGGRHVQWHRAGTCAAENGQAEQHQQAAESAQPCPCQSASSTAPSTSNCSSQHSSPPMPLHTPSKPTHAPEWCDKTASGRSPAPPPLPQTTACSCWTEHQAGQGGGLEAR